MARLLHQPLPSLALLSSPKAQELSKGWDGTAAPHLAASGARAPLRRGCWPLLMGQGGIILPAATARMVLRFGKAGHASAAQQV